MRFLFIIDTLGTGGAERMVISLSEGLLEKGHDVSLLVIKKDIALEVPKGVSLYFLDYEKRLLVPYNLMYAIKLKRYVADLEAKSVAFDAIFSNLNLSNRLTHMARLQRTFYCIHEAVSISSLSKRKGLKRFFRSLRLKRILNGKDIITVSDGIRKDLLDVVGVKPRSIRTIYNGVSFNRILSMSELDDSVGREPYVVHVGRLSTEKRHDILLQAFKRSGIDCMLYIVGDGPEKKNIEDKIKQLGLQDKVKMLGNLDNPYPVIKHALLTILSSDYEGLPTVLVESFVLSTPVVSVDCNYGPAEILGEKYQNFLAKQGDIGDLAEKIKNAISDMQEDVLKVSPDYVKKFDIAGLAGKYVDLVS